MSRKRRVSRSRMDTHQMMMLSLVGIVALVGFVAVMRMTSLEDDRAGMVTLGCEYLMLSWDSGRQVPYDDQADTCGGYRCIDGERVDPTCFADEPSCASSCTGQCVMPVDVPDVCTPSCSDECSAGATRCSAGTTETCGNYDADTCTEWGNSTACESGACSGGVCSPVASCGDAACNGQETCETCSQDCGACAPDCTDADDDGAAAEGGICGPLDCNDSDASVHPGAQEICDGRDNDCDGTVDEGCLGQVMEAESMTLERYVTESILNVTGIRLAALDSIGGNATAQYVGPAGTYDLVITYIIEDDGAPRLDVLLNGISISGFTYERSASGAQVRQHRVASVTVAPGDVLRLRGWSDGGAFARVDKAELVALPEPVCGNGLLEGSEECDDGDADMYDACGNRCLVCDAPLPSCPKNSVLAQVGDVDGDGCGDYECRKSHPRDRK